MTINIVSKDSIRGLSADLIIFDDHLAIVEPAKKPKQVQHGPVVRRGKGKIKRW